MSSASNCVFGSSVGRTESSPSPRMADTRFKAHTASHGNHPLEGSWIQTSLHFTPSFGHGFELVSGNLMPCHPSTRLERSTNRIGISDSGTIRGATPCKYLFPSGSIFQGPRLGHELQCEPPNASGRDHPDPTCSKSPYIYIYIYIYIHIHIYIYIYKKKARSSFKTWEQPMSFSLGGFF